MLTVDRYFRKADDLRPVLAESQEREINVRTTWSEAISYPGGRGDAVLARGRSGRLRIACAYRT